MKKLLTITIALALAACSHAGEIGGGLVGGAGAGYACHRFVHAPQAGYIAIGCAVLGTVLGSQLGRQLDEVDELYMGAAADQATRAPVGKRIDWQTPNTDHRGSVTPTREGRREDGCYCREYRTTVAVGDKYETAYGTACLQPDGEWKVQP